MRANITALSLSVMTMLISGSAMASSCGSEATTMLRRYGLTENGHQSLGMGTSGSSAASTTPVRPGGVASAPMTNAQQQKLNIDIKKALASDQAGNMAECESNLTAAKEEIK